MESPMIFENKKQLQNRISEFRKNTKYVSLFIETVSPISNANLSDFIIKTDVSLSPYAFSNEATNIYMIRELCGVYEACNKIAEQCKPGAINLTSTFEIESLINRVIKELRPDMDFKTLYPSFLICQDSTCLNARTGELSGYLPTGRYPTSEKIAHDFLLLAQLEYLDVKIHIWDSENEPSDFSEYGDEPLVNGLSFHINKGKIKEVSVSSEKQEQFLLSDIYEDNIILYEMGMPLNLLSDICSEAKSKLKEVDFTQYIEHLNLMHSLNAKSE